MSSQMFERIRSPKFEVHLGSIEKASKAIKANYSTLLTSHSFESVGKLKKFASGASEKNDPTLRAIYTLTSFLVPVAGASQLAPVNWRVCHATGTVSFNIAHVLFVCRQLAPETGTGYWYQKTGQCVWPFKIISGVAYLKMNV